MAIVMKPKIGQVLTSQSQDRLGAGTAAKPGAQDLSNNHSVDILIAPTNIPVGQVIDTRLKMLSNSSCISLHTCPRKYQLNKLYRDSIRESNAHLAFGSMFGEGLQQMLCGVSMQQAILSAIMQWDIDLYDESVKDKTVWHCIMALEAFYYKLHDPFLSAYAETVQDDIDTLTPNILTDYEVAIINGRYATEVGFAIVLDNGFVYRGYVDVVLKHKYTNEYLVVDIKHTAAKYVNNAKYQNSPQCLGYSIVMDKIAPGQMEFGVVYYEYFTGTKKYHTHYFTYSLLARAKWLYNLSMDKKLIEMYSATGFPQHGESCIGYNRPCQYLLTCGMSDDSLFEGYEIETRTWQEIDVDNASKGIGAGKQIDIIVSIEELIQQQLAHIESLG